MAKKGYFDTLHDAHLGANAGMQLTPQGSGGYDMDAGSMTPTSKPKLGLKQQSAAQHAAVTKAGRTSAMKRKIRAGKTLTGLLGGK